MDPNVLNVILTVIGRVLTAIVIGILAFFGRGLLRLLRKPDNEKKPDVIITEPDPQLPPVTPEPVRITPPSAAPSERFIGRDAIRNTVLERLKTPWQGNFVTLWGMGGVGKSALAGWIYNYHKSAFPAGQYWVNLKGGDLKAALRGVLVEKLEEEPTGLPNDLEGLGARFRGRLDNRQVLVVWDNAETLGATALAIRQQLRTVLVEPPGVNLVTSRVGLQEGLDIHIDTFDKDDALNFLQARFKWSAEKEEAEKAGAEALIAYLGGLALGLVLATGQMVRGGRQSRTCAGQVEILKQQPLIELPMIEGQAHLAATFVSSYNALPDDAREVFHLLGVCARTGATESALAEMQGGAIAECQSAVTTLLNTSLAELEGERVSLHPLLHQFADYQAKRQPQYDEWVVSHAKYYGGTIGGAYQRAMNNNEDSLVALLHVDAEVENVKVAQIRATTPAFKAPEEAVAITEYLASYWRLRDQPELLAWLVYAEQLSKSTGQKNSQANVLKAIGDVRRFQDENDEALKRYEEAQALFQQVGDRLG